MEGEAVTTWPSARDINVYWVEHSDELPSGISKPYDWNEPTCFACGWYNGGRTAETKQFQGLERAHVVPRALGGGMDLSNFALLCGDCHRESPDTGDAEWFWRWCASRPLNGPHERLWAEITEVVRLAGITGDPGDPKFRAIASASPEELLEAFRRAGPQVMPSSHFGVGLSLGTKARLVGAAAQILSERPPKPSSMARYLQIMQRSTDRLPDQ